MKHTKRIKAHLTALNSVMLKDEASLEKVLNDVKQTVSMIFGANNHYLTYLNSIYFRPALRSVSHDEATCSWEAGVQQLKDLLQVMAKDPLLGAATIAQEKIAAFEIDQAERIVAQHVDSLPRIRIDLRDINILSAKVTDYLVRKNTEGLAGGKIKLLFFPSCESHLDDDIFAFLTETQMGVIPLLPLQEASSSLRDLLMTYSNNSVAVVALSEDCNLIFHDGEMTKTYTSASPRACFSLGYLMAALGRERIIVLHREIPAFFRPTQFFDAHYIMVNENRLWERELLSRLRFIERNSA